MISLRSAAQTAGRIFCGVAGVILVVAGLLTGATEAPACGLVLLGGACVAVGVVLMCFAWRNP